MKKLYIILFLIVLGFANDMFAQCSTYFTYVDNGNGTITFTDSSSITPPDSIVTQEWHFGDGIVSNSTGATVTTHTHFADGTYTVYYGIYTTTGFCGWYTAAITVNNTTPGLVVQHFSADSVALIYCSAPQTINYMTY